MRQLIALIALTLAVNMAARIAAKSDGGEILVSDVVRQLVAGKKFVFSGRGEIRRPGALVRVQVAGELRERG